MKTNTTTMAKATGIKNLNDADLALLKWAELKAQEAEINARRKELEQKLEAWAQDNRGTYFAEQNTLNLENGKLSFVNLAKVQLNKGFNFDKFIDEVGPNAVKMSVIPGKLKAFLELNNITHVAGARIINEEKFKVN